MKFKVVKIKLSEDLKDEIKRLREEIAKLKEQITEKKRAHGIFIDIGSTIPEQVKDITECIIEGIHGELEKSIFVGPRGIKIIKTETPPHEEPEANFGKTVEIMNALAHEHRIKILKELMSGGKYINELQEKMPEITTSTLSSHLDVLEKAGMVVQEKVRGRYLITIPGRTAYKMAVRTTKFFERGMEE